MRMNSLHLVNKAWPARQTLLDCLQAARPGDALLLLEDGVLCALAATWAQCPARRDDIQLFVLAPDAQARGLLPHLHAAAKLVDQVGFVSLVEQHKPVLSWR